MSYLATYNRYGSLNLTVTNPAQSFVEPLTLPDVQSYLGLPQRDPVDPGEDAELAAMITAAREQAEILQGRDLVRKQWDMSLDYWTDYNIQLRDPLVSVDLVQYRYVDGAYVTMTENANYIVDTAKHPGCILPPWNVTWPAFNAWPSSAILVRFTSGFAPDDVFWSDAGMRVRNGMKLLISAWYNNRLPFELGASSVDEYPFTVKSCLGYGAIERYF